MGTNRNILRPGQKERLRRGAIQGSCYYNHFLKDKTFVIVTHRPRLKQLCNKHYVFEEHMMKEVVKII